MCLDHSAGCPRAQDSDGLTAEISSSSRKNALKSPTETPASWMVSWQNASTKCALHFNLCVVQPELIRRTTLIDYVDLSLSRKMFKEFKSVFGS